jgi:hypothetical protein
MASTQFWISPGDQIGTARIKHVKYWARKSKIRMINSNVSPHFVQARKKPASYYQGKPAWFSNFQHV